MDRRLGCLGLKDLRKQVISFSVKWIIKVLDGSEPCKVLMRNNIALAISKGAKHYKIKRTCLSMISLPIGRSLPYWVQGLQSL